MKDDKSVPMRTGLTDMTNSSLRPPQQLQKKKSPLKPPPKSHVEKLLQENAALIKLIEEKDKMVEASGTALQKLRVNFQKLQAQNTTLAKSNTQFLTELNAAKDKLRVLQHELACKNVVLKAKDMDQEEKVQIQPLPLNVASQEEVEATKPLCDHTIANNKPSNHSKKQNQQKQTLGASSTREKEDEKFKVPNRRQSSRGQSGIFQTQVPEPEDNLFEIEEAKYPITQPVNMPKPDQKLEMACSSPRSSMGRRPLRRAAEKVQSYKEIPLNIKMRRME